MCGMASCQYVIAVLQKGGQPWALRGGSIGDVSNLGNDMCIYGSAAPCLYF